MSKTYKALLDAAQDVQDRVRAMADEAGKDTSRRLLLEQCYSALGMAIRAIVILSADSSDDEATNG